MASKLKINRGTTYSRSLTYQKNGVTVPMTGMTVFFTVKRTESDDVLNDSTALISKTLTNLNDANAAAGKAIIVLNPTDTLTSSDGTVIPPGEYVYDIKVKESPTVIYKVDEGTIILDGSPTNRVA